MTAAVEIRTHSRPSSDFVSWLNEKVRGDTIDRCGVGEDMELAVLAVEGDQLIGGCYGLTWGGTCDLQGLWVDPLRRHQGIGRRLLDAAESEAARRGCRQIALFTHAPDVPSLYERHGYLVVGVVEDYPAGTRAVWWLKRIQPS